MRKQEYPGIKRTDRTERSRLVDDLEDLESRRGQTVKIVGATVFCNKCEKELGSFYCPCGTFFCAFDISTHKCLHTLKKSYSEELISALK